MRYHRILENSEIPTCLKNRKLKFGDLEQIMALYKIEDILKEKEELEGLPYQIFDVHVDVKGSFNIRQTARTKDEAKKLVYEMDEGTLFEDHLSDLEIWNIYI